MNKFHFSVFFVFFLAIYGVAHFYVFHRISIGFNLNSRAKAALFFFVVAGGMSFVVDRIYRGFSCAPSFSIFAMSWFGWVSIAVTVFLLAQGVSFFFPNHVKTIIVFSVIFTMVLAVVAVFRAYELPQVKSIEVPVKRMPENVERLSLVHLSDLHIDGMKSSEWLSAVVQRINNLSPDVVVITGDIVDRGADAQSAAIIKKISSKYGVFAVTGNHEFYGGIESFLNFCKDAHITVLRNESVLVAGALQLAGVDDDTGKRMGEEGAHVDKALKHCYPHTTPIIFLSHKPLYYEQAEKWGVDLQLSGHTHRGQIPPYNFLVPFFFRYSYGLHRYKSLLLYTTSGAAFWGPPMRLFSRSEIVLFVLRPALNSGTKS